MTRLPWHTRTGFGPVTLRHFARPGRLVMEAYRGGRRLARLKLVPAEGHVSLLLGRSRERPGFWSMKRGLPVEHIGDAITSFDVVNRFSAEARMGADIVGAGDAALLAFIRQRVDGLLATLNPVALRRARRFPEWKRLEVYVRSSKPGAAGKSRPPGPLVASSPG